MTCRHSIVLFHIILLFSKAYPQSKNSRIRLITGKTLGNYDWNVAGDISGQNPTVLSELFFNDINYTTIGLSYSYQYRKEEFSLSYNGSNNGKGKLIDIDYLNDNRQNIYNYEEHNINRLTYSNYAASWRHSFYLKQFRVFLSSNLNYEKHHFPLIEESSGLDSYYRFSMKHLGLSTGIKFRKTFYFELQNTIYLSKLKSEGFWNLRSNFKNPSFIQHAIGGTSHVNLLIEYPYRNVSFGLTAYYKTSFFRRGTDITYTITGEKEARLNAFNSNNTGVNLFFSLLL